MVYDDVETVSLSLSRTLIQGRGRSTVSSGEKIVAILNVLGQYQWRLRLPIERPV